MAGTLKQLKAVAEKAGRFILITSYVKWVTLIVSLGMLAVSILALVLT